MRRRLGDTCQCHLFVETSRKTFLRNGNMLIFLICLLIDPSTRQLTVFPQNHVLALWCKSLPTLSGGAQFTHPPQSFSVLYNLSPMQTPMFPRIPAVSWFPLNGFETNLPCPLNVRFPNAAIVPVRARLDGKSRLKSDGLFLVPCALPAKNFR